MKKLISVLCVLILSLSLCPFTVNAAEIDVVPLGVCAVVSDDDGNTAIEDAQAIEDLDSFQSYELYIDRKPVLSVDPQNSELAATGISIPTFYHAEFMLPDTTLQVYLTGLRNENIEEIQQKIIDNFVSDTSFDLYDLSFIDTEKTSIDDGDEYLCWAAASSNMLYYTGWGAKAGFSDEDALFDLFASSFTDDGSHQENAMAWFFNGAALQRNSLISFTPGAKVRNYPRSGGYFRDYAYDMVSGYRYVRGAGDMNVMFDYIKKGYGVSPGISLQSGYEIVGAHAITLWGMVTDLSYSANQNEYYHGVLISDSDSHMVNNSNRRKADRVLSYYPLYVNSRNAFCFDYPEDLTAIFDDFEYLMPYSKKIPIETNSSAGRDKTKYSDLIVSEAYLNNKNTNAVNTLFESGSNLYFGYAVSSTADKAWRSSINTKRSITNAKGKVIYSDTDTISISYLSGLNYIQSTDVRTATIKNIPAGDYTLSFTVNPNHNISEAYYYNNTRTIDFRVRDSYLRGDYDNNSVVNSNDTTQIMRKIVGAADTNDEKAEERANVDGGNLNITDVTFIQRFLINMKTPYEIGTKALYQDP